MQSEPTDQSIIISISDITLTWKPHPRLPEASVWTLLTSYLDITTPPSPNLFSLLAQHTQDQDEKAKLELLARVIFK